MQTEGLKIVLGYEQQNQAVPKEAAQNLTNVGNAAKSASVQLQNVQKSSGNLRSVMGGLNNVVRDAPFGFIAIQNNLTQVADAMFGASKAALAASFGLSLIVTGITAATQHYGSFSNAILALTGQLEAADVAQQKYTSSIAKSIGDVQGEISVLNAYLSVAKDETVSRQQRQAAIENIQKEYPGYLDNINLENINSKQAAASIDALSQSLIRKAKVQGAQNIIAREQEKIFLAQNTNIIDQTNILDKLSAALAAGASTSALFSGLLTKGAERQNKTITESQEVISNFEKIIASLLSEEAAVGNIGKGVVKSAKEIKKAVSELDIIGLQGRQDVFQAPQVSKFKIKPDIQLIGVEQAQQQLLNQLKPIDQTIDSWADTVTIDLEETLQSFSTTMVSGIATAVGSIIGSGGDLQTALNGVVLLFADFISQLGESMVASGLAVIAAEALITNPFTAVAAGAIAIAAGAAIKASLKKAPSFATGGTVFGPTMALVGDNPARKEHILSDAQLQTIAGNNLREVRVYGIIRGRDIHLSNERAINEGFRTN